MKNSGLRPVITAAFLLCLGILVVGCKPNPEGKYTTSDGTATVELKSGKATVTTALHTVDTFDYTVDGDKITLSNKAVPGAIMVLTMGSDGTLSGPYGSLKKSN